MLGQWLTLAEIAQLVGKTRQGLQKRANKEGWIARKRAGRGGGKEFEVAKLPEDLRTALVVRSQQNAATDQPERPDSSALWAEFERKPETLKKSARDRLQILAAIEHLVDSGLSKTDATHRAAKEAGVGTATVYRWAKAVDGAPRSDWLPLLAPNYNGRTATATCDAEAWDFFKSDYLRPEAPAGRACYDRLTRAAKVQGWQIPSYDSLMRRLKREIPREAVVLAREGREALLRSVPQQRRDRSVFHALEAVNADGHKFDVFVRWPDGEIGRPLMVAWQDIYSGRILSWRIDKTENTDSVRLSFGDLVEEFGIPGHAYLDNGRGFASKWMTGGTKTRYRFKIRDEEPAGILTQLGVAVHWATPYHGQAKPIERAFRDLAEYVAKHPALSGAYTGNRPDAKPENYGKRAVDLDHFLQVLADEIRAHNARAGRRSPTCAGRSFDQTFAESYASAAIRKATAEQRRLWLLAAEGVSCSRQDASITLMGNRYWSEALAAHAGRRVVVRFDPAAMWDTAHVYTLEGRYIGAADCIQAAGFNDSRAARELARARRQKMHATRQILAVEKRIDTLELAKRLPEIDEPEQVEARIVRPFVQQRTGTGDATPYQPEHDIDEALAKVAEFHRKNGI